MSIAILMAGVGAGTVQSGLLLRRWTPPFNLLLSRPDNILRGALVVLCIALGLVVGPGPAALGWGLQTLGADLLVGTAAGLLLALGLSATGWLAMRHWGEGVHVGKLVRCILPRDGREWPAVLLALLVAAALEEMLFRSLPLGGLHWLLAPWWLLWPLSFFFGALHWPQGWWGIAGTTLAGIALSLLFLATGSIWVPLAAHYAMNVGEILMAKALGVKPLRGATG